MKCDDCRKFNGSCRKCVRLMDNFIKEEQWAKSFYQPVSIGRLLYETVMGILRPARP